MTHHPVARLHRRRVLSAVAVAAVTAPLTGCEDVPLEASGERAVGDGTTSADPDEAVLADAVSAEAEMLASLQQFLGRAPARLRPVVRRTIEVHQAHLDLLRDEDGPAPSPRPVGRGQVAAAEERLARRHAEAAVRATSGPFARVLASMAAGAAQQAEVWRTTGSAS